MRNIARRTSDSLPEVFSAIGHLEHSMTNIGSNAGAQRTSQTNALLDQLKAMPNVPDDVKKKLQEIQDQFMAASQGGSPLPGAQMEAQRFAAQAMSASEGAAAAGQSGGAGGDPMTANSASSRNDPFSIQSQIQEDPLAMAKLKNMAKGGGAMSFERMVHEFMKEVVKEQQEKVKGLMDKMKADSAAADGGDDKAGGGQESRAIQMEELKFEMQQLTQMMQALSNVNNTMHQNAKNSIQNIRA